MITPYGERATLLAAWGLADSGVAVPGVCCCCCRCCLIIAAAAVQAQSASLGVIAGICQVLLALWKVMGSCSVLQVEAVLQNVLLRLADGENMAEV